MAQANVNLEIDAPLKRQAQKLFESLGLSMSAAVTLFLRQAVRERAIPFRVGAPLANAETVRAVEDARRGAGLSRAFSSVCKLMADLDADD